MEVLGLKNDKIEAGTNVIIESSNMNDKKDEVFQKCQIKKDEQTWFKGMAILVVEFSREGCKIRKVFG